MDRVADYFSALQPLDQSCEHIRLLTVHAAHETNAPIECTIFLASLYGNKTHATLSYAWGDPSTTSPIFVNGIEHNVTLNLKAALQYLRNTGRTEKPLWIDALCINQKDILEKNVQIMYMAKIFEKAYLTLVWLGEEKEDSSMAMKNIRLLGDIYMKLDIKNSGITEKTFEDILDEIESRVGFDLWSQQNILAFVDLFDRPWWRRRWIVQEAALAKRVLMMCGGENVPWEHFVATSLVLTWIQRRWAQPTCQPHPSHVAGLLLKSQINCLRIEIIRNKKPYATLLELLGYCRTCEQTDPRDAIYGLLSLASCLSGLIPDYRKTTREVYHEYALKELSQSHSLAILHHSFYSQSSVDDGLPSWVPDWRSKGTWRLPAYFNASGDVASSLTVSESRDRLQIQSLVFGKISKKYHVPSAHFNTSGGLEWMKLILNQEGFFKRSQKWIYSILRAIALDQTLAGKVLSNDSAPDIDMMAGFLNFLEEKCKAPIDMVWEGITHSEKTPENIAELSEKFLNLLDRINNRRIICTENGFLGIAPPNILQQDLICIIAGCQTPFVIRKVEHGYLLIGQCFVVDAMNGEVLGEVECGNLQWEQLDLV